jgi:ATP-grasp domain
MSKSAVGTAFQVSGGRPADPFRPNGQPRTVLVVPSMTLDGAGLVKIPGVMHYEERFLAFLHILRDPLTRVVFVTSVALPAALVDYTLAVFGCDRDRLTLMDCADPEPVPLTEKVLRRNDLVAALRDLRPDVLVAFNGSPLEHDLASRVGAPLFAADPALASLGSKTGSRRLFAEAGVPVAPGHDGLRDVPDVIAALAVLRAEDRTLDTAVVKLNDSFGAGGNVMFSFEGAPETGLHAWVERELPTRAVFASPPDTWDAYAAKVSAMGAVVERFVRGKESTSPSAQLLVDAAGARVVSTHDQVLSGQIFIGATAPAHAAYRATLIEYATRVGAALHAAGMVGIASVDFVASRVAGDWSLYALEINLRMGGGTAPHFIVQGLVRGEHTPAGELLSPDGTPRSYYATDRVLRPEYAVLTPSDVIAALEPLGFTGQTGTVGYMLGALSIGRFGLVTVEHDISCATTGHQRAVAAVDAAVPRT